jgi:predicted dehydrogenase
MDTNTRRKFLKTSMILGLGTSMSASSYKRILGSNDRVRVGVVGFSDRFKQSLFPGFTAHNKKMNFEIVALSDIWKHRREEGKGWLDQKLGANIKAYKNNDDLYASKDTDAVFISTADFQHATHCIEAMKAGQDAYVEKPLAETMADANAVLKAVKDSKKIVQIGSQRRSGPNYHEAEKFIKEGKFGDIVMVELMWNVNQPGRWRRPSLVAMCKEEDLDWNRFLVNRPKVKFDPRKYLEYRLFWPYSSGIPGQWMSHQIDTVHWFSGLEFPRSVVANGGIYQWKDGRTNADTMSIVFDYGPQNDKTKGFQVTFTSRFSNAAGDVKELYYSNGGMINLDTNEITPTGGLTEGMAKAMGMNANLLTPQKLTGLKVEAGANTGGDVLTTAHVQNWMECVRDRKRPNAPIEAGYQHSVANIMSTAAYQTGNRVTFDPVKKEVIAAGKVWKPW